MLVRHETLLFLFFPRLFFPVSLDMYYTPACYTFRSRHRRPSIFSTSFVHVEL